MADSKVGTEVERLYVTVSANVDEFNSKFSAIHGMIDATVAKFSEMGLAVTSAAATLNVQTQAMMKGVQALAGAIPTGEIAKKMADVRDAIGAPLTPVVVSGTTGSPIEPVARMIKEISSLPPLESLPKIKALSDWMDSLNRISELKIGPENIQNLQAVEVWLSHLSDFKPGGIPDLSAMSSWLKEVSKLNFDNLPNIGKLSNWIDSFASLSKIKPEDLPDLSKAHSWLGNLSTMSWPTTFNLPPLVEVEKWLSSLDGMMKPNTAGLLNVTAIQTWLNDLKALSTGGKLDLLDLSGLQPWLVSLDGLTKLQIGAPPPLTNVTSWLTDLAKLSGIGQFNLPKLDSLLPWLNDVVFITSQPTLQVLGTVKFPSLSPLKTFLTELADLTTVKGIYDLAPIANSLQKIGGFLSAVSKASLGKIDAATLPLRQFVLDFSQTANMVNATDTAQFGKISVGLQRIASIMRAVSKMDVIEFPKSASAFTKVMADFVKDLAAIDATGVNDKLLAMFTKTASILKAVPKADPTQLKALTSELVAFASGIAALPEGNIDKFSLFFQRIGTVLRAVAKTTAASVSAITASLRTLVVTMGTLPPQVMTNLTSVGAFISKVTSLLNASVRAGGAGLPPPTMNVNMAAGAGGPPSRTPAAFSRVGAAASGAVGGIRSFTSGLTDMFRSATQATTSLSTLRLTLAGFAGLGIAMFAKFDDALTRTLGHMRDWSQQFRPILEGAVLTVSSSSVTGANDLAKALDTLTASGMNAAMAAKGLAVAETFSVSSGMNMGDATEKLVHLQRALGMSSEDVERHFANMNRLGDLFVGMAPMVGSSTKDLIDSFGNKFVSAAQMAGMSLKDMIVLQGVYSLRGIKGSEASDTAARALQQISIKAIENVNAWRMLDVVVFQAGGKMRPLQDIASDLTDKLSGMGAMQKAATLSLLGLEMRTLNAIRPLVGMNKAFDSLGKEVGNVDGVMKKMAEMMRGDFLSQLKILWNNISAVAREIGRVLAPGLAYVADQLGRVAKWFTALHPHLRQFIVLTTLAVVSIGPIIGLIGTITAIGAKLFAIVSMVVLFSVAVAKVVVVVLAASAALALLIPFLVALAPLVISIAAAVTLLALVTAPIFAVLVLIGGAFSALIYVVTLTLTAVLSVAAAISVLGTAVAVALALLPLMVLALAILIPIVGAATLAIVALYPAVEAGISGAIEWVKRLYSQWDDIVGGAKNAINKIVGFFYNFGQNVEILLNWLEGNWHELLATMLNASIVFVSNLVYNIGQGLLMFGKVMEFVFGTWMPANFRGLITDFGTLGTAIADVMVSIFAGMNVAIRMGFVKLFDWLKAEMGNIGKSIANTIIDSVNEPIMEMRRRGVPGAGRLPTIPRMELEEVERPTMAGFLRDMQRGIRLGTERSARGLRDVSFTATADYRGLQDAVKRIFGDTSNFRGMMEGFETALTSVPALNLLAPELNVRDLIPRLLRNFAPAIGMGDEGAQFAGKQGPGFTFKQISEKRYMVGGPAAETLDYQQLVVLQSVKTDTAKIAAAAGIIAERLTGGSTPSAVPYVDHLVPDTGRVLSLFGP